MVQTDGRADVRTVIWPPKFLVCIDNQPFLLMVLCHEMRAKDQIQFPGSNSESFADFSTTINFTPDVFLSSQTNLNSKPWNKEARREISVLFPYRFAAQVCIRRKKRRKLCWIWVRIGRNCSKWQNFIDAVVVQLLRWLLESPLSGYLSSSSVYTTHLLRSNQFQIFHHCWQQSDIADGEWKKEN